jgi:heme/copper-type cytochrome/quinol oxidase subunit 2
MKTKMLKHLLTVGVLLVILTPAIALATPIDQGLNYARNLELADTNQDPRDAAVNIVRYLMTFLGIIAVVVILIGGFRWLTASGNEDKVASAKRTIIAGVIGLIVILAAFAIVTFVINTSSGLLANGTI